MERSKAVRPIIIEIEPSGDPYGSGFVGIESRDDGDSWYYRGDIGARPRQWWRDYARREGAILRARRR